MEEETCLCEGAGAEEEKECLCGGGKVTMIFACSGVSNVGQMANKAAVDLSHEAPGVRFACLAGIGGHVSGIVESARAADRIVVVDGCHVKCGKKTLDHAPDSIPTSTLKSRTSGSRRITISSPTPRIQDRSSKS